MKRLAGHDLLGIEKVFEELASYCKDKKIDYDQYGNGRFLNEFENELAEISGFESALFLPSGVMAQLIALRIWADDSGKRGFACHETSHLIRHEEDSYKHLHLLEAQIIGKPDYVLSLADVKEISSNVSTLVYELPMRHLGGDLPSLDELDLIKEYCNSKNIKLHIDGARIFECLPFYGIDLKSLMRGVDSLFVSFYKGFGSTSGSMLLGSSEFISLARTWLRRHGGNLFQLYPLAIPAKMNYERRKDNFSLYYEKAKSISKLIYEEIGLKTIPQTPKTNMFHAYLPISKSRLNKLRKNYDESEILFNVGVWSENEEGFSRIEFSVGDSTLKISDEDIVKAFSIK